MKTGKKFLLTLLAVIFAASFMMLPASSAADPFDITITGSIAGRDFYAYQIVDFGTGYLNPAFSAFNDYPTYPSPLVEYIYSLDDQSNANNRIALYELARKLTDFIDSQSIANAGMVSNPPLSDPHPPVTSLTIEGLDPGYYLVVPRAHGTDVSDREALNLVRLIDDNIEIKPKHDAPDLIKEGRVIDPGSIRPAEYPFHNTHTLRDPSFGDRVSDNWNDDTVGAYSGAIIEFRITTKVPENVYLFRNHPDGYTFSVFDKVSAGLTPYISYENNISVTLNGNNLPFSRGFPFYGYNWTLHRIGPYPYSEFEIRFNPAVFKDYTPGDEIVITYIATLKADAVEDQYNDAYIRYSNAPDETRDTVKKRVRVRTHDFDIFKHTGDIGTPTPLPGATFEIRTDPNDPTTRLKLRKINDNEYRFSWATETVDNPNYAPRVPVNDLLITPSSGRINIRGLPPGTYYIVEIEAPDGYNLLDEPVVVTLPFGDITIDIKNERGIVLPTTGGGGIAIFAIVGLSMLLATATLVIVRKRMPAC